MENANANPSRHWLLDIVCLSLILLLFYSFWLGGYALFTPDEGRYSEAAREMVMTGDYLTPHVNGVIFLDKPILYYWLQALAIKLFGLHEWSLRLFPMLLGVLGCILTYICGRLLFDRRTGLLAAIILATTPLYFGNAHFANLDLEVTVFISVSLLCVLTGLHLTHKQHHSQQLSPYFIYAAYIFSALAVLTKGLIGIAFPAMIALTWMACAWRWDLLKKIRLLTGTALFMLIALPWYILVQQANPEFLRYFFITQQVTRFLSTSEFNNETTAWFYIPIILIGFFPWTIFLLQTCSKHLHTIYKNRREHLPELFLLIWFTIIFIFFSIPRAKTIGYILPVFPPLALLTAKYLADTWTTASRNTIRFAIGNFVVIGFILAGVIYTLPQHQLIDITPQFTPYVKAIAWLFASSACCSLFCIFSRQLLPLFSLCSVCSAAFLMTLIVGAEQFNQNSAKPLVADLKTIIKPDDVVMTYFKYYQDVPLYLEQRVLVTTDWNASGIIDRDNWAREMWYGKHYQDTAAWLIDEDTFWKNWYSEKRVFVFINENFMDQFRLHAKSYFILGKHFDIMLLSNKPTYLSRYKIQNGFIVV